MLTESEQCSILRKDPGIIKDIEVPTFSMLMTALSGNGLLLKYVISRITSGQLTGREKNELYLAAVGNNGKALKFIPFAEQTDEIIKAAVKNSIFALRYSVRKDFEIFSYAIDIDPFNIMHIYSCTTGSLGGQDPFDLHGPNSFRIMELIHKAVEKDPRSVKCIKNADDELWEKAVSIKPETIRLKKSPSYELCRLAVTKDPETIIYVPAKLQKHQLQKAAVKYKAELIRNIHKPFDDIQIAALKADPSLIDQISFPCPKACKYIIDNHPEYITMIHGILNQKTIDAIIQKNPEYIRTLTDRTTLSDQQFLKAAQIDGLSLRFIPPSKQTHEITSAAVSQNPLSYKYAFDQSPSLFWFAFEKNPYVFQDAVSKEEIIISNEPVKKYRLTDQEKLSAVSRCGSLLKFIDPSERTEQLCRSACDSDILRAFEHVPLDLKDLNLKAVQTNGDLIRYIDSPDEDVCMEAVKNKPESVLHIKGADKEKIRLYAVKKKPELLKKIDVKCQTENICQAAVAASWIVLDAALYQTDEICISALDQNLSGSWYMIKNKNETICEYTLTKIMEASENDPDKMKNYSDVIEDILLCDLIKPRKLLNIVKKYPQLVLFIKEPDDHYIFNSVINDRSLLKKLSITDEMWQTLIAHDKTFAADVPKNKFNIIKATVKNDRSVLKYFELSGSELKLLVIGDPDFIQYIEDPDPELCLAAVKHDGLTVKYIKRPDKRIVQAAIDQNPDAYELIDPDLRHDQPSPEETEWNSSFFTLNDPDSDNSKENDNKPDSDHDNGRSKLIDALESILKDISSDSDLIGKLADRLIENRKIITDRLNEFERTE